MWSCEQIGPLTANILIKFQGDSGGPLQIAYEKGLNLIIGITSYGFSCATKHPTVYTRVAAYTDWIAGVVTDW